MDSIQTLDRTLMSSSFPAARFSALSFTKDGIAEECSTQELYVAQQESSDDQLIARIAAQDREALALLFHRYARLVWTVAERIVRNKTEADDLLQDVFLLIARRAAVFDSSKGSVRSLVVHMTYQAALSRRRYLNARACPGLGDAERRVASLIAPTAHYEQSFEARFGREKLRQALQDMSEDQRATFQLYFVEGYTLPEIAGRLDQSIGQVKHHYYRGLERLRRLLPKS